MNAELRDCVAVPVPPGPAGVDALMPALSAALAGSGPAVAPLPTATSGFAGYRERILRAVQPGEPVPEHVAVVAATSGSTGDPAGVLLPESALRAAASGLCARFVAPDGHQWVAALPLQHAGGLMVAVRSALTGTEPVAVASLGGAEPFTVDALAEATALARGRSAADGLPLAVSLVPAMLAAVDAEGSRGWDLLCEFDLVLVGGAAAPRELVDRLLFAGVALSRSYGMTETCGGAVFDGRPLPGMSVRTDPAGRVVLTGDQVALGYRDGRHPDRWAVTEDGRRSFRTEDLGSVAADGRVEVHGRADDIVQVGGASVSLGAVRAALLADARVGDAEVVALPDERWGARLVALVVHAVEDGPDEPCGAELGAMLAEGVVSSLGPAARPRDVRFISRIPLMESGKPDRVAVAELVVGPTPDADRSR